MTVGELLDTGLVLGAAATAAAIAAIVAIGMTVLCDRLRRRKRP